MKNRRLWVVWAVAAGLLTGVLSRDSRPPFVRGSTSSGNKIVFQSWSKGGPQIYTMNSDGTRVVRVTPSRTVKGISAHPCWAPGQGQIAFASTGAGGGNHWRIWISNADGSNGRQLTSGGGHDFDDRRPSWSYQGDKIAFDRTDNATNTVSIMVLEGSNFSTLRTVVSGTPGVALGGPAWSPDGNTIAFALDQEGGAQSLARGQ